MTKKIFTFLIVLFSVIAFASDFNFDGWGELSMEEKSNNARWLHDQISLILQNKKPHGTKSGQYPPFSGKYGLFITLVKDNQVRGCYGSFYPQFPEFETAALFYLKSALRSDARYEPLDLWEIEETSLIITLAGRPVPVNDPFSVDIFRSGIYVKYHSGDGAVFVPGEIKTTNYLLNKIDKSKVYAYYKFEALTMRYDPDKDLADF